MIPTRTLILAVLASALVSSLATLGVNALVGVATANAQPQLRIVSAEGFALVDRSGNLRASLEATDGIPYLRMYDNTGDLPVGIGVDRLDAASVLLFGNGQANAVMGADSNEGGWVRVNNQSGQVVWSAP